MEFKILGPLQAIDDAGRELALGGRMPRAVLAILLLHGGDVVSSDRLVEELWAGEAPPTAVKSLQVHISRLRRALGGDGRLQTVAGGYSLWVEPGELDCERFEALVAQGGDLLTAGDAVGAAAALDGALELWRGRPLADFDYDSFAQADIARLSELHVSAVERRVACELALGRDGQAVAQLERLVREHPYRERLRVQLMLALYRSGRQADALEAYRQARSVLVEELGIEPSAELRELHAAILSQDPSLLVPAGVASETVSPATILFAEGLEPAVFADPAAAVHAAIDTQRSRRVRIGLHTGLTAGGEQGLDLRLAERVGDAANEGQIVITQATRDALDGRFPVADLGAHRLKDFPSPERLFQVVVDGRGPSAFGPLRTAKVRPTNLLDELRPLMGREPELVELGALLEEASGRPVSILGLGGTGKTRLALALAARMRQAGRAGSAGAGFAGAGHEPAAARGGRGAGLPPGAVAPGGWRGDVRRPGGGGADRVRPDRPASGDRAGRRPRGWDAAGDRAGGRARRGHGRGGHPDSPRPVAVAADPGQARPSRTSAQPAGDPAMDL